MSSHSKHKKENMKGVAVRIISLCLAILMVLSVLLATVWRW